MNVKLLLIVLLFAGTIPVAQSVETDQSITMAISTSAAYLHTSGTELKWIGIVTVSTEVYLTNIDFPDLNGDWYTDYLIPSNGILLAGDNIVQFIFISDSVITEGVYTFTLTVTNCQAESSASKDVYFSESAFDLPDSNREDGDECTPTLGDFTLHYSSELIPGNYTWMVREAKMDGEMITDPESEFYKGMEIKMVLKDAIDGLSADNIFMWEYNLPASDQLGDHVMVYIDDEPGQIEYLELLLFGTTMVLENGTSINVFHFMQTLDIDMEFTGDYVNITSEYGEFYHINYKTGLVHQFIYDDGDEALIYELVDAPIKLDASKQADQQILDFPILGQLALGVIILLRRKKKCTAWF
ncbi:MAG: hypothetical protein INQ03_10630 [Candidatus Heimdallarchaeota archaeon]|nr:hypothetical protein [Candidatus Heimdallarchaeota archaeon]